MSWGAAAAAAAAAARPRRARCVAPALAPHAHGWAALRAAWTAARRIRHHTPDRAPHAPRPPRQRNAAPAAPAAVLHCCRAGPVGPAAAPRPHARRYPAQQGTQQWYDGESEDREWNLIFDAPLDRCGAPPAAPRQAADAPQARGCPAWESGGPCVDAAALLPFHAWVWLQRSLCALHASAAAESIQSVSLVAVVLELGRGGRELLPHWAPAAPPEQLRSQLLSPAPGAKAAKRKGGPGRPRGRPKKARQQEASDGEEEEQDAAGPSQPRRTQQPPPALHASQAQHRGANGWAHHAGSDSDGDFRVGGTGAAAAWSSGGAAMLPWLLARQGNE